MKRFLISLFFHNFPYKLAALVLSVIFWYIVQGEEVLEINRRLEVNLVAPSGLMVRGDAKRYKDVTLRGPRVLLSNFSTRPLEATIRVPASIARQAKKIRVDKDQIDRWDNRIKLLVHDPYVNVYMDQKDTRRIPVREVQKGAPAEGYMVEKVIVKPNTVDVTWLKSDVALLQEVLTEPIDISGLQQSQTFKVGLVPPPGYDKSSLPSEPVDVSFQISEKKEPKKYGNIAVEVMGTDRAYNVRPSTVALEIQGTSGVLTFVKSSDFRAFVEVRDFPPGKFDMPVQVKIPPDTVFIRAIPEKVTVEIFDQKKP